MRQDRRHRVEALAAAQAEERRQHALGGDLRSVIVGEQPSAALDLVGFMFYDFGAQAMLDERSFLNKRMQTGTIMSPRLRCGLSNSLSV